MTRSALSVSVVIPAYNAEAFLSRAIDSALAQTLSPESIFVVDDGSTDGTLALARRYEPRVRVISQANGGPAAARNAAIRASDAEWIGLLDADDAWHPTKLERQAPLTNDERIGVVQSKAPDEPWAWPPGSDAAPFDSLWVHNRIRTSTVLIRRSALESVGLFDEDRQLIGVEDYDCWLKLARAGWRFAVQPGRLIDYNPHEQSLTRQVERFSRAELYQARKFARDAGLATARLRSKENAILKFWGFHLFHMRHWAQARPFLRQALATRFEVGVLARLALTFLPARS